MVVIKGNPCRAIQPARKHERFLQTDGVGQGNLAHDESGRPAALERYQ